MESFRNFVKGWPGRVFLGIVVFVFVVFAFAPQFSPPGAQGEVAEVNGRRISEQELDQAVESVMNRYGDQVDRKMLEQLVKRGDVLESLIRQRVSIDTARDLGFTAHPELVQESITSIPAFQGDDGKFSQTKFQQLILANGFANAAAFRTRVEEELLMQQFTGALRDSAFATRQDLELLTRIAEQKRDVSWVLLSAPAFIGGVSASDAEVRARYDSNPAGYMTEEQFSVEYVEIKVDTYAAGVKVDDAAVAAKYDEMVNVARQNAERRIAHILISKQGRDDAAARQRAGEVLDKLTAGSSFTELAAQYSDDTGSAGQGGDLGYVGRGVLDPALDAAVSALKVNDVSAPVKTADGLHILKVLEVRQVEVPPLASARADIVRGLQREEAMRQYQDAVDQAGSLAYEAEGLQDIAQKLGVSIQKAVPFGRAGGQGVVGHAKVLAAVLSPEVLEDGRNSAVIDIAEGHGVVVHLVEHRKPARRPFEEVASLVRQEVLREKAGAVAREKAEALRKAVAGGQALDVAGQSLGLTMQQVAAAQRNTRALPPEVIKAVFRVKRPAEGALAVDLVSTSSGEVVFTVGNVVDGNLLGATPDEVASRREQLATEFGRGDISRFTEHATAVADVTRYRAGAAGKEESAGLLESIQGLRNSFQEQRP